MDCLRNGKDEPVLSCPDCLGPFQVLPEHLFMLIFTSSLVQALEHICSDVNTELCRITKEQFDEKMSGNSPTSNPLYFQI